MIPHRVVIVGGGISGLAVAHRLTELARGASLPLAITLLEARDRFGGVIATRSREGFLAEDSADAFLTEKPWAVELCTRLGLEQELVETQPAFRRSFLVHRGRLVPVPSGWYLLAPDRLGTLFSAPFLSWPGKVRMACEPLIPARTDVHDESLASFVRRRLGREALERVAQPMVGGIYTADPERLSLQAAMPKLLEMERQHGSILRALRAQAVARAQPGVVLGAGQASGPRYSLFMTLRGGMQALVDALLRRMPDVSMRHGAPVERLRREEEWTVALRDGAALRADAVCLALPTHQAAAMVRETAPRLAEQLAEIAYVSVATVHLAFRRSDIPHPLDGFGFVVPDIERRTMVGCTFSSVKFSGRAPEGAVLLRAFVGGARHPGALRLDDRELVQRVQEDLRGLLGVSAPPRWASVHRFADSMPQYHVGHLARVARIEATLASAPGLYLTGNGYRGIGIPDCIHHAEGAAQGIIGYIRKLQESPSWAAQSRVHSR